MLYYKCEKKYCNISFTIADDNLRYNKKTGLGWLPVCPKCKSKRSLKKLEGFGCEVGI
jgi:hypothetical protein